MSPLVGVEPEVKQAVVRYLDRVRDLHIVREVVFGRNGQSAYAWNVFADEVSLQDDSRDFTPYETLNDITEDLRQDLADVIPFKIAHINPSQFSPLQKACNRRHIEVTSISLI